MVGESFRGGGGVGGGGDSCVSGGGCHGLCRGGGLVAAVRCEVGTLSLQ